MYLIPIKRLLATPVLPFCGSCDIWLMPSMRGERQGDTKRKQGHLLEAFAYLS